MSDPQLPVTGAGTLTVGAVAFTMTDLALAGVAMAAIGLLLVLMTVRFGWRRGRGAHQA